MRKKPLDIFLEDPARVNEEFAEKSGSYFDLTARLGDLIVNLLRRGNFFFSFNSLFVDD